MEKTKYRMEEIRKKKKGGGCKKEEQINWRMKAGYRE